MTTKQASRHSGLSDAHLRRLLETGTVQGIKAGRDWLVDVQSLKRYMANRPRRGRKVQRGQNDADQS